MLKKLYSLWWDKKEKKCTKVLGIVQIPSLRDVEYVVNDSATTNNVRWKWVCCRETVSYWHMPSIALCFYKIGE